MKLFAVSEVDYDDGGDINWQLEYIFSTKEAAELYVASRVKVNRAEQAHFCIEDHFLHTGVEIRHGKVNPV